MHETFDSDGLRLTSHLSRPPGFARVPGLVMCHGFPTGPRGGDSSASTYPELAERLARETGWAVLTFNFRGTGASEGDFSLDGWLSDLTHAVNLMSERSDVGGVWLAGSSTGGSLAIILAADDERRAALDGKTVLALDPLAGQEVLVLALRAHRLVEPATVPEGDLGGLAADPADGPASEPALSEAAFQARFNGVAGALPGGLTPPG